MKARSSSTVVPKWTYRQAETVRQIKRQTRADPFGVFLCAACELWWAVVVACETVAVLRILPCGLIIWCIKRNCHKFHKLQICKTTLTLSYPKFEKGIDAEVMLKAGVPKATRNSPFFFFFICFHEICEAT